MRLAADVKKYLNEPDKRFRRVRDKFGNLQLSENAKAYHPGRGVYRSSARNAQRLARTEINMAYRTAEQERWKQFDFVVGYEVKTTQNGKHEEDICDCLSGKYPKTFKFVGWHPHCLCYCIPLLKTEDEFWSIDDKAKSVNEVTDVPQGFKDWVADNRDRIEQAEERGKLPYFLRDNREEMDRALYPEKYAVKKTPQEIAAERHAARTPAEAFEIQLRWNQKLMNDLYNLSERIGSYRDADFRELASLLDDENQVGNFKGFRVDYKRAKEYIYRRIEADTALVKEFMNNPANAANMKALAKTLGIEQRDFMTFFEANELRGNPNYAKDEIYRVNCQTCVVAHELRRRGFNIQALGNTKGSWLEKLSHGTQEIWRDADGNIPQKKLIGATRTEIKNKWTGKVWYKYEKTVANRKQLIKALESEIIEDGRYHIDWDWNTGNSGHIITLERTNGKLRYYDPQTGKVIDNFYDYIDKIELSRGINLLRVDNLQIDIDWASKILQKAGGETKSGIIDMAASGGTSAKLRVIPESECNYTLPNGGRVSTPSQRLSKGNMNKQEQGKFEKELRMAKRFANGGHKIEFAADDAGSFDVLIDGVKADFKSTSSPKNIIKYAKHATREQGADIVLFEFTNWGSAFVEEIEKLKRLGYHGKYLKLGDSSIYTF